MFVCVASLSQPSSRDVLYVKCLWVLSRSLSHVVEMCNMFNVCVLSRYLSPVVEDVLYVKCLCVLSHYLSQVEEMCYMLNVCGCCLVISAQQ